MYCQILFLSVCNTDTATIQPSIQQWFSHASLHQGASLIQWCNFSKDKPPSCLLSHRQTEQCHNRGWDLETEQRQRERHRESEHGGRGCRSEVMAFHRGSVLWEKEGSILRRWSLKGWREHSECSIQILSSATLTPYSVPLLQSPPHNGLICSLCLISTD